MCAVAEPISQSARVSNTATCTAVVFMTAFCHMDRMLSIASDRELALEPLEVVADQRQVGPLPVQDQVEEQAMLVAGVLEQPDQVVLLAEGDQDVLDGVVEPQRFHRPHLWRARVTREVWLSD